MTFSSKTRNSIIFEGIYRDVLIDTRTNSIYALYHQPFQDPNAPKRGKSSYMFWLAENRARLSQPGMSVVDVTRAAGAEWNAIEDKSKWVKLAADDKERYQRVLLVECNLFPLLVDCSLIPIFFSSVTVICIPCCIDE